MARLITTLIISFLLLELSVPVLAAPTEVTWYGQSAFRVVTPAGKILLIDPWTNSRRLSENMAWNS